MFATDSSCSAVLPPVCSGSPCYVDTVQPFERSHSANRSPSASCPACRFEPPTSRSNRVRSSVALPAIGFFW